MFYKKKFFSHEKQPFELQQNLARISHEKHPFELQQNLARINHSSYIDRTTTRFILPLSEKTLNG